MAAVLFLGALLWLKVDASQSLGGAVRPALVALKRSTNSESEAVSPVL
jgi:hypothetical protein